MASRVVSLRGARKLQTIGMIGGSSSFTANTFSKGSSPSGSGSTSSIDGNLMGMSKGMATISGPNVSASGKSEAGGTGTAKNAILATTDPGVSTVTGSMVIDTQGNFAGGISPSLTGGLGGGSGSLTVTSTGTGTGPTSVSSENSGNIFGGGQAMAANQFGSAGGMGSGVSTAASSAKGTSAMDLLAEVASTGKATGTFDNSGGGAFASPGSQSAVTGNSLVGGTRPLTASSLFSPTTSSNNNNAQPSFFLSGASPTSSTNAPPGFTSGGTKGFGVTGSSTTGLFGLAFP
jgi:hypothetical protein